MKGRGLYRHPKSPFWFLDYVDGNGKRVRESSRTEDRAEAQRILDDKRGRVARGEALLRRADQVRFEEAMQDVITKYEARRTRDMQELRGRLAHLARHFTGRRLNTIQETQADEYTVARRAEGAADGTIINELDCLIRILRTA